MIDTTRGDRLFISLLGSAFICLAWLGWSARPCGERWRSPWFTRSPSSDECEAPVGVPVARVKALLQDAGLL